MENLVKTYLNKRVFITGHTGFKGAWLAKILTDFGAQVKGYALAPDTNPNLFELLSINELCESEIADIRDPATLEKSILAFQPDFVFHLAAQPLVIESYRSPVETFMTNSMGTTYMLEAIRKLTKPCQVVVITTDKVYRNEETGKPYLEDDALGGYDPYSASKACSEIITASYRSSFFNPNNFLSHQKALLVFRAGNVIGGGDWSQDRLIPDIVTSLVEGKKISIRNPLAVRPWQHVLEPIFAYLKGGSLLQERYHDLSGIYNIGPLLQDNLTVENVVKAAIDVWGNGQYEDVSNPTDPHEAQLLHLDISRAQKELEWQPKWSARDAIEKTIDWYKQYQSSPDTIVDFTKKQIQDYISL